MAGWHKDEAERSWLRHAAEGAKSGDKGRADTVVDECRNEMVDPVARYRLD